MGNHWINGFIRIYVIFLATTPYHCRAGASLEQAPAQRFERAEPAMGTIARIVVEAGNERAAAAALNAAFARIREIDERLSDYREESEARRLEGAPAGRPAPVSRDLFRVLEHGLELARETGGAFDPTLGRATRAWRGGGRVERGRYRDVELGQDTVTLRAGGVAFDFGGIAKGYAADEALKALRERGFASAMVAISGDIALGAPPAGRRGWRVGLGSATEVEELAHCGVSTSGDARQARQGESHILDGRAGRARAARAGSVTVVAPSAMQADAMATAIHAMGKEEGEKRLLPKSGFRVIFHAF